MHKAPAFQFYPSDWIASQRIAMMSLEEEGAYIRLLLSCWQHGSIPASPELCARIIGKGASTTLATVVQAMFQPDTNDASKLVHDRLEQERQKQAVWRQKSAEGGRKSAEKRASLPSKCKGGSRVVQPPHQPKGNSSSSSSSTSKGTCTLDEAKAFAVEIGMPASDGESCFHKWTGNGWMNGQNRVKDWKATIRSWQAAGYLPSQKGGKHGGFNGSRQPKHAAYDAGAATLGLTAEQIGTF